MRRGCGQVVIATHSFQAPAFYERFGYERRAVIEGRPKGHAYIIYAKRLTEQNGTSPRDRAGVLRQASPAYGLRSCRTLGVMQGNQHIVPIGWRCGKAIVNQAGPARNPRTRAVSVSPASFFAEPTPRDQARW